MLEIDFSPFIGSSGPKLRPITEVNTTNLVLTGKNKRQTLQTKHHNDEESEFQ